MKKLGIFLLALAIGLCGCSAPQTASPSPEPESGSISTAEKAGPPQGVPISLNYEYDRRELWAQRDGKRIYGEIFVPKHAGEKLPAVIFSHGFGGSHQVGDPYAQGLAARGYVVYCFDFCGGSPGSRSDGSPLEMSIFTEQADLEAVIQMVKSLDYVDRENVFLMGSSQGGAVSAITAAANPEEVQGAVLLYPAFILADTAKELFSSVADIPETYYHMWMTVGKPYFEPLLDYDIYEAISSYRQDFLILHGDMDSIVPLSGSERAQEVYPSARLEVFPGAGHGFSGEDTQKAIDFTLAYLDSHRKTPTVQGRQIRMTTANTQVIVTLNDSQAAADLLKMLSLELTLIERNRFAKGMTLPAQLSAVEPITREYQIGGFGYWDAGPDLAIFYDDIYEQTIVPVIPLGRAETGAETMRDEVGTVRLELVP